MRNTTVGTRVEGIAQPGDVVAYEDMANPRRTFLVTSPASPFGSYRLLERHTGKVEGSDLRQRGWTHAGRVRWEA